MANHGGAGMGGGMMRTSMAGIGGARGGSFMANHAGMGMNSGLTNSMWSSYTTASNTVMYRVWQCCQYKLFSYD